MRVTPAKATPEIGNQTEHIIGQLLAALKEWKQTPKPLALQQEFFDRVKKGNSNFIVNVGLIYSKRRSYGWQVKTESFSDIIKGPCRCWCNFSAEWCGPCKMMPPILKEVKDKLGDSVTILKMDIDRNPAVASAYQIQSVPTLIVFRDGQVSTATERRVTRADQLKSVLEGILH